MNLDYEHLPSLLEELDDARKRVVRRGKDLASEAKEKENRREVEEFLELAKEEVRSSEEPVTVL